MRPHHHFRNRSARAVYESHHGPNMTPMVDVVMVILIFFMASAAILGPEWFLKTSLPVMAAGKPTGEKPPRRLTIWLTMEGAIVKTMLRMDQGPGKAVGMAQLAAELRAAVVGANGEVIALVEPADDVPYEAVVAAHEACAKAGIVKVGVGAAK